MNEVEGFEEFFATHYSGVLESLTLVFGSRDAAEDAAQDGFARCLHRWTRVAKMERPEGWVYVVAVRAHRRRLKRGASAPTDHAGDSRDLSQDVSDRAWVRAALASLPPRQRLVLVLRFLVDLPIADVAEAMGCSVGTVKAATHQALKALRVREEMQANAH